MSFSLLCCGITMLKIKFIYPIKGSFAGVAIRGSDPLRPVRLTRSATMPRPMIYLATNGGFIEEEYYS